MIGPSVAEAAVMPDGELGRVAVVLHRLDLDRAEAAGVGDRGAGHAGEDHAAHDVDVPEPALQPADQREREVVDAVGDPGGVHQVAGEDEERHREQREAVDAADHAVDHGERGNRPRDPDVQQRGERHRHRDRQAGHQRGQEAAEEETVHGARSRLRRRVSLRPAARARSSPAASGATRPGSSGTSSARSLPRRSRRCSSSGSRRSSS